MLTTIGASAERSARGCSLLRVRSFVTLWTAARQAPLSMGFSKQEYWSRLPCPLAGDLPNPGIKPASPASAALQADSLPPSHQGSLQRVVVTSKVIDHRLPKQIQ